jgi:hypothetical protein
MADELRQKVVGLLAVDDVGEGAVLPFEKTPENTRTLTKKRA